MIRSKLKLVNYYVKQLYKNALERFGFLLKTNPLLFLLLVNTLLVLLIVFGRLIAKDNQTDTTTVENIKRVEVYRVGTSAKVKVKGKVETSSSAVITALTSGLVKSVDVVEGQKVAKNKVLARLSSNYWGANANYIQSKIAKIQLDNAKNNYDTQKEIIAKNKELVSLNKDNRENLNQISKESVDRTTEIINLNNEIISTLDSYLNNYQATNSAGINDALILSTKQLKSQYLSANNQLKSSLSDLDYRTNNETPNKIADLNDDIVLKQLDLQLKTLELQVKLSELQYKLSKIQESLMYPSALFDGVIEKVYIKPGQLVSAGTPLFVLNAYNNKDVKITAYVSESLAANLSLEDQAKIIFSDGSTINLTPYYISSIAVEGDLYSVYFKLPAEYIDKVWNNQTVEIELVAKFADSGSIVPIVPLESVYLLNEKAYVLVVDKNNIVKEVKIVLGKLLGGYVVVESGLDKSALVVLSRNAVAGDKVEIAN
ncbi:MAG: secretion protein HlyD [Patescibacteria group bacterium]|nr:MAG: secretion protein HlyD [Patescibacteria group bacterium]